MSPDRQKAGKPRRRRARGSLSEEEIVNAAIALVERDGVDGLSMVGLAESLNAGVMSVYWYFRNKEDLLLAMADRALTDLMSRFPSVLDGQWDDQLMNVANGVHHALREHSLYIQLCRAQPRAFVVRPAVIPSLAPGLEAQLQLFQETGLSASEAVRIVILLGAFARGFALIQLGAEDEQNGQSPEQALEASVQQLSPAKFPLLRAAGDVGAAVSVSDESFHTGVRLMVAGLKAELELSPHAKGATGTT